MTAALAECAGVTRRFGEFTAVDRVDLHVRPGEVVGLLGANGAGKTTLIRMLLGLTGISGGEVRLFGLPPSRETRRRIGYVPQGLGLYDDLTIAENLAFSRSVFGGRGQRGVLGGRPPRLVGRGVLGGRPSRLVGRGVLGGRPPGPVQDHDLPASLRPFAAAVVGSLPLGVTRRAAFAQALGHAPELLILDEPTSGVDPLARARLWETIQEAVDAGAGALVTTHYMDEAQECGRLVVMAGGRVVAEGTVPEIVGEARVTVVESDVWAEAFAAVEAAGLPAALAGRTIRVPGATPAEAERALGGLHARLTEAPATLEERFFQLALPGSPASEPGPAREAGRAPEAG